MLPLTTITPKDYGSSSVASLVPDEPPIRMSGGVLLSFFCFLTRHDGYFALQAG